MTNKQAAVAYVRKCFGLEKNPSLAGRELTQAEARELFTLVADAFVAGRQPKSSKPNGTITVQTRGLTSHFLPDGVIEHEGPRAQRLGSAPGGQALSCLHSAERLPQCSRAAW